MRFDASRPTEGASQNDPEVYRFVVHPLSTNDPRSTAYLQDALGLGLSAVKQIECHDLYFVEGHLKQHTFPPIDPSTTTFVTIRLHDTGDGRVRADIIPCVEGKYLKPDILVSLKYETAKNFRERVEKNVKNMLLSQRRITDWATQFRKKSKSKKSTKRKKARK